jgi:hypothetical protein
MEQIQAKWETVARGPFRVVDNEDNYSETGLDVEDVDGDGEIEGFREMDEVFPIP